MVTEEATKEKKIAKASIGFVRQTARKVRRTANLVRNMKVGKALTQLKFLPYAASEPIKKLISSAAANAKNNLGVENPDELVISQIFYEGKINATDCFLRTGLLRPFGYISNYQIREIPLNYPPFYQVQILLFILRRISNSNIEEA